MNALNSLEKGLFDFYHNFGVTNRFKDDFIYLNNAYDEIEKLWRKQFDQMQQIKYIIFPKRRYSRRKKAISTMRTPLNPNFSSFRMYKQLPAIRLIASDHPVHKRREMPGLEAF